ncbi:MAG TPA: hypothetical protein VGE38_03310 [Nocardioides sp.]|uniref:hypothetical protein n=1 Tax=Nocardioides sp. TaxID=35761 RepID=UPI002EDAA508
MAETTTITALPTPQQGSHILIEDDASPLVRLIGRTLGDSARSGHAADGLARTAGVVAVRSHDTPQAATIAFGAGAVEVSSGVLVAPDATVVVDLHARFAPVGEPSGDAALAAGVLRALQPPLPHWREAAARFWQLTRGIRGVPEVLLVDTEGPDGPEHGRFGEGATEYLVAGPADLLAGVFSGADDFLTALASGLRVRGTLSQMSVMTAASWKVRFDV